MTLFKKMDGQEGGRSAITMIAAGALLFFAGFAADRFVYVAGAEFANAHSTSTVQVTNLYSLKRQPKDIDFNQFWQVWNELKSKYVDQPVSDSDLFYGALQGMVAGLHDPHSVYFPPKEASEFKQDLSGEFEGIGAQIGIKNNVLTVIAPLPDSPAEKAGLKAGYIIASINGVDTASMSLEEAVAKIRGANGTTVTLVVESKPNSTPKELKIVRAKINVPTVRFEMKPNHIAYIRMGYFNQETWPEFDTAISKMLKQSPQGVILDLRSNPGGYLETAIDVASEWIQTGTIVSERSSAGVIKTHDTRGTHRLAGLPTVVLVDKGSASASEIVSGALQDYGFATLVGETTYGKGSVQDFETLSDNSALKITIAKWLTPKKREIDRIGITPDVVIPTMFVPKNSAVASSTDPNDYTDAGLEKALEILQKK